MNHQSGVRTQCGTQRAHARAALTCLCHDLDRNTLDFEGLRAPTQGASSSCVEPTNRCWTDLSRLRTSEKRALG